MNKVAHLSDKDRQDLFRGTGQKMGINEAIIEKDFWVCWTLKYLFHVQELEKDYKSMQSMLFGDKPTFTEIMNGITLLEKEINAIQP